ncbi:hypothetical protein [Flavihumibacter sp. UBA7668]|uniref:hypothetical protein n=1 Tax=Flavihumibacter sp. UBA7668 TaxID=1946542 RepID=UPI0025C2278B|nr:hypothetical protein [Flavihumibacter sp. UBA7668]
MTSTINIATNWYPEKSLLVTNISGDLEISDIEEWEQSFKTTLDRLEDKTSFKIFVNMHGFRAVDISAHKRFRSVIPLTLADFGWKVGYVDLFEEEAKNMVYRNIRGIACTGAAHAHQDETKMDLYEQRFSSERERFFTDPLLAKKWIEELVDLPNDNRHC